MGHFTQKAVSGCVSIVCVGCLPYSHPLWAISQFNSLHRNAAIHPDIRVSCTIPLDMEICSLVSTHIHKQSTVSPFHAVYSTIIVNARRSILIQQEAVIAIFRCGKGENILSHLLPQCNRLVQCQLSRFRSHFGSFHHGNVHRFFCGCFGGFLNGCFGWFLNGCFGRNLSRRFRCFLRGRFGGRF